MTYLLIAIAAGVLLWLLLMLVTPRQIKRLACLMLSFAEWEEAISEESRKLFRFLWERFQRRTEELRIHYKVSSAQSGLEREA